jgi:single-strand DNA-binding protein
MINIVTLVGRVGVEPEIKTTTSGLEFCNFSLATNKKIKKNEIWEDKTTWHPHLCSC